MRDLQKRSHTRKKRSANKPSCWSGQTAAMRDLPTHQTDNSQQGDGRTWNTDKTLRRERKWKPWLGEEREREITHNVSVLFVHLILSTGSHSTWGFLHPPTPLDPPYFSSSSSFFFLDFCSPYRLLPSFTDYHFYFCFLFVRTRLILFSQVSLLILRFLGWRRVPPEIASFLFPVRASAPSPGLVLPIRHFREMIYKQNSICT